MLAGMSSDGEGSKLYRSLIASFNEVSERGDGKFRILLTRVSGSLVLRIEGSVIIGQSQSLFDKVRPVLTKMRPKAVAIDLSLCEHLSSPAVGFIALTAMEVSKQGGAVHLVRPTPKMMVLLKVLGIDKLATVADTVEAALGA